MNPSKGPRRDLRLRLPVALVEQLERERDARHAAGLLRPVDGLPALVEEAVALRHDRDAEMDRIRAEAVRLEDQDRAKDAVIRELRREVRRLQGQVRTMGARRAARAQVPLRATTTPQEAFLRDHGLGEHAGGPMAGCPACSTGSQGVPPPAQK